MKQITLLIIFLVILSILLTSCKTELPTPPQPPPKEKGEKLSLTTQDDVEISGTFYKTSSDNRPVFILLHMLGRDSSTYSAFVDHILKNNYNALTLDFRGHGSSDGDWNDFSDQDFQAMINDVKAAITYISTREDVDSSNIVIVGASIGANIALNYAVNDDKIKYLVLLSPGLDYRSVNIEQAIVDYGDRPIEIVASEGDKYSYDSGRFLTDNSVSTKLSFRTFSGNKHGTDLFTEKLMNDLISDVMVEVS